MNKLLFVLSVILSLLSCRTTKEIADEGIKNAGLLISPDSINIRGPFSEAPGLYAVLKVYFSTSRNLTTQKTPSSWLGTKRSTLKYGVCHVSIPRDHKMGELERPSIWRLELQEDSTKHITLRKIIVEPKAEFFKNVQERLAGSAQKEAFIFVHGYNVSFADAALRTAQLAYDLGFDGIPVFYSWPSKETYTGYTADEATIEWAQVHLKNFLTDFIRQSSVKRVHLIAHSMGNRALTRAVSSLLEKNAAFKETVSEIILAAPDIDTDVFRDDIAPALTKGGKHITLYSSATDKALLTSKALHGGINRIGDVDKGVTIVPGIETIDATNINTSLVGHSNFSDSRSVLSDMFNIIKNHLRPDDRPGLKRMAEQGSTYWQFSK